jgi:hypothetical protein
MEIDEFEIFRLKNSSPESVFNWLRENRPVNKSDFSSLSGPDREEIEKELLSLKQPLIDLGLAFYGYEAETGLELFKQDNRTIKKAVLAGTTVGRGLTTSWVEDNGVLKQLVKDFDKDLLAAYISNKNIKDDVLVNLFEKSEYFNSLSEEKWITLIWLSTSNKRLSEPYDDSWMDGASEYLYNKVFTSAWHLFETLPVNKKSAAMLSQLGEQLVANKPHDIDVMAVLQRWKNDEASEEKSLSDSFLWCRYHLAKLFPDYGSEFKALVDSGDLALRQSYYTRFRPDKPEDIRKYYDKDGEEFLFFAVENERLYFSEETRKALHDCCWDNKDSDLLYPNLFNSRSDYFKKKHPDWFEDEYGYLPIDQIEDKDELDKIQLRYSIKLQEKIQELTRKIEGLEYSFQERGNSSEGMNQMVDHLLTGKSRKGWFSWIWAILGAAIAYLILR